MLNKNRNMFAFALAAAMTINTVIPVSASSLSSTLPSAGAATTLNGSDITVASNGDLKMTAGAVVADNLEKATLPQEAEVGGETVLDVAAEVAEEEADITISGEDAVAESAEAQYANLVIAKCNDYVNVRQEPSEEAEIVGKLYNKSVGDFVSEADGGWYQITSGSVTGYVKAEYCVTGEAAIALAKEVGNRIATVTTTTLFVREEPTVDSAVLGMVGLEDDLSVLQEDELDGWVKVPIEEGEGYVSTEFVELHTEFVKAESKAEEEARLAKEEAERKAANAAASKKSGKSSSGSGSSASVSGGGAGASVASYALQFVGNPYVYGGSSLTNGTDCSGFTMSVYANFGISLPHSSGAQRGCGYDVGGLANAQPGDLVCYSGHVGLYIGGGQIVHASTAATGIKVSNADYRSVLAVRRIF